MTGFDSGVGWAFNRQGKTLPDYSASKWRKPAEAAV
jgi:hypothetical protein